MKGHCRVFYSINISRKNVAGTADKYLYSNENFSITCVCQIKGNTKLKENVTKKTPIALLRRLIEVKGFQVAKRNEGSLTLGSSL